MPGNTPVDQAVYVATSSGTTIVFGEAAMNVSTNVDRQIPLGFLDDMTATTQGLRRLRKDGNYVVPAHDPEVFSKYSYCIG